MAGDDCFVGVVGALIDAVGIAGVVEEVDVGLQVVQAADFGGVVVMLVAVGVVAVAAAVAAAVDAAVAGLAGGNLSALVEVAGVGMAAGGVVKVVDIVGAGNLSGVAGGFAGVVVVEPEVATGTAAVAVAAAAADVVDTSVSMNMSAGVDDAAVALATPWSATVLSEEEVGSVADVADERYVGAADWDEDDDRRVKRS
jgi:hypothetical protein